MRILGSIWFICHKYKHSKVTLNFPRPIRPHFVNWIIGVCWGDKYFFGYMKAPIVEELTNDI